MYSRGIISSWRLYIRKKKWTLVYRQKYLRFTLALCLSGCCDLATPPDHYQFIQSVTASPQATKTLVLECGAENEQSQKFTLRLNEKDNWLIFGDKYWKINTYLPTLPGNFKWVGKKAAVFNWKGRVVLATPEKVYADCINLPHEAPWEKARLDGLLFRAHNPELGWLLEIQDSKTLRIITGENNYTTYYQVINTKLSRSGNKKHIQAIKRNQQGLIPKLYYGHNLAKLEVEIFEYPCINQLGQPFNQLVRATLGPAEWFSCGNTLNLPQKKSHTLMRAIHKMIFSANRL